MLFFSYNQASLSLIYSCDLFRQVASSEPLDCPKPKPGFPNHRGGCMNRSAGHVKHELTIGTALPAMLTWLKTRMESPESSLSIQGSPVRLTPIRSEATTSNHSTYRSPFSSHSKSNASRSSISLVSSVISDSSSSSYVSDDADSVGRSHASVSCTPPPRDSAIDEEGVTAAHREDSFRDNTPVSARSIVGSTPKSNRSDSYPQSPFMTLRSRPLKHTTRSLPRDIPHRGFIPRKLTSEIWEAEVKTPVRSRVSSGNMHQVIENLLEGTHGRREKLVSMSSPVQEITTAEKVHFGPKRIQMLGDCSPNAVDLRKAGHAGNAALPCIQKRKHHRRVHLALDDDHDDVKQHQQESGTSSNFHLPPILTRNVNLSAA